MELEFRRKGIRELKEGAFYQKNDGQPFEVSDFLGNELLKTHGEILKRVEKKEPKVEAEVVETEAETVESLAKEKREVLEKKAKKLGLDGNTYTNKTELASAIIAMERAEKENK